jgi:hypothetical protein
MSAVLSSSSEPPKPVCHNCGLAKELGTWNGKLTCDACWLILVNI